MTPPEATLHASTVAVGGQAVLILGPSGAGKSGLALQLMALGAGLIADDRTLITRQNARLIASCPPALSGLIEARGLGLLRAPVVEPLPVGLVIDLGQAEPDRLPPHRSITLLQCRIDLVFGPNTAHFPAAVLHYLRYGRQA